jgi:hypothetical protein
VPYTSLNLTIHVEAGGNDVRLQKATRHPFLYSSDSLDYGVAFHAPVGHDITVSVKALGPPASSSGELVVRPYWTPDAAADIVFASGLQDDLRPWTTGLGFGGVALMGIGIGKRLGRRSQTHQHAGSTD